MSDSMNEQPPVVEQPAPNAELQKRLKEFHGGANWFYWIAALSVINSLLMFSGSKWSFIFGLGVTSIIDALAAVIVEEMGGGLGVWFVRAIALGFSVAIAAAFVLIGWLSNKGYGPVYVIGMIIYLLDALLYIGLLFIGEPDWLGLGFHAFALFLMFSGYSALRKLDALQTPAA